MNRVKSTLKSTLLAAGASLALAFTLSCSGVSVEDDVLEEDYGGEGYTIPVCNKATGLWSLNGVDIPDANCRGAEGFHGLTPICNTETSLWNVNGADIPGAGCNGLAPVCNTATSLWNVNGADVPGANCVGADGADGSHGLTPVCNAATGLWSVDGKDVAGARCVGADGKDGADGRDGIDGADGKDGIDGKDGKNGTNGINGSNGANGVNGRNGADGQSCDVEIDGAHFVMKCGGVEKARWAMAICGGVAYDPEAKVCKKGQLEDKEPSGGSSSSSEDASSSSSEEPSSSSSDEGLCAGFVEGTERLHYGPEGKDTKPKPQFCDKRDGDGHAFCLPYRLAFAEPRRISSSRYSDWRNSRGKEA